MLLGLRAAAVVLGGLLVPVTSASAAEILYGTTGTDLVRFNATTPGVLDAAMPIRNLPAGVSIVGLDERPVTLGLYGIGSDARLYRISKTTALATGPIGPALTSTPTGPVGIDFSPAVDRLRLVTGDELNLRVNPTTGAQIDGDAGLGGVQPDAPLSPAGSIASIAYDRSVHGTALSGLFAIDTASDKLVRIGGVDGSPSPNGGAVTPIGSLGVDAGTSADLDISPAGNAYALLPPTAGGPPVLSRIDLTSGTATPVAAVAAVGEAPVTDIAIGDPPPTGLSVNNAVSPQALVRYPTDSPVDGEVQALLFPPAATTITSLDRRPSNGELIAAASDGALYRVDESTGALTRIGDPGANAPAVASIGFDISPTTDTVRAVTPADVNVRLNPFTAPFATTPDTALAYAAGDPNFGADPNVEAVAYTDSRPNAVTTSLYGIDTGLNTLVLQNPPNQGTLTTIGSLGADPGPNAAFDFPPAGTSGYVLTQLQGDTVTRLLRIQTLTGVTNNPAGGTHELGIVGFGAGSATLRGFTLVPSGQVSAPAAVAATERAGSARITLARSAGDGGAGNVEYDVTAGTATAGADVTTSSGTVTFEDGQRTATIEIPVVDDSLVEDPETVTVTLARPGGGLGVSAGAASATVTITSDDAPAPAPAPTTTTGGGSTSVSVTPLDTVKPVALIAVVAPRLRGLRAAGLRLRLLVGEPATASVVATVDARTRARLKLKSARITAKAAPTFASGQARTITLKLTKDAKARLARARSVVLTVTAVVTDTAGNRTTVRERVTVRR